MSDYCDTCAHCVAFSYGSGPTREEPGDPPEVVCKFDPEGGGRELDRARNDGGTLDPWIEALATLIAEHVGAFGENCPLRVERGGGV